MFCFFLLFNLHSAVVSGAGNPVFGWQTKTHCEYFIWYRNVFAVVVFARQYFKKEQEKRKKERKVALIKKNKKKNIEAINPIV